MIQIEKSVTAKDMEKYLADRYYDSPQWVFLTQVRSSTGGANRIADAMAFNMYGSTGYEIIGFEIKVSRSDFLSELKNMSKSNEIMEYCDKWYLVVPDANIVRDGELPKNWGLLILKDGKLVQKTRPIPKKPSPMPMCFIASILRRSGQEVEKIRSLYIKKEDIATEIEEARKRGYESGIGYDGRRNEEELKKLRDDIYAFETASGLKMESWRNKEYPKTLGMYVKFAMGLNEQTLNYSVKEIEIVIKSLSKAISDISKIKSLISN